ncbi:hypothetical protein GCM10010300_43120 [Streptomyces olivaceoviridis]|nr:hypothetical protein GCM10010300_43120 [Streptomyces olivaceoviridis]
MAAAVGKDAGRCSSVGVPPPERHTGIPYWPEPTGCATFGRARQAVSTRPRTGSVLAVLRGSLTVASGRRVSRLADGKSVAAHSPMRRVTFNRYSFRFSGLWSVRGRSGTAPRTTGA